MGSRNLALNNTTSPSTQRSRMVKLQDATWFDYVRFTFSFCLLTFSAVVTFYAILEQKTAFWSSVPGWAALIIFVGCLFFLAVMEGLQIALVELKRQEPETYMNSHPKAFALGQLAFKGDNVERFLLGRQVFVVCLVFFAAKLTTIHSSGSSGFLFPVHPVIQVLFLETGLLACVVVVIVSQLLPQIIASKYPVQFMQLSLIMRPALLACLALEFTGITHMCWVFATLVVRLLGVEGSDGEAVKKEDWEVADTAAPAKAAKKKAETDGNDNQGFSRETREYA